jgi:hypothetical protein
MKLKSFGCSFIFGSDLADGGVDGYHTASNFTWPALLAQKFGVDYICYAHPGVGNLRILEQVLNQSVDADSLFVINWTWIDRYDHTATAQYEYDHLPPFRISDSEAWRTILPADQTSLTKSYYKNLHSQYRDKLTTLCYIRTAIDTLNSLKIPFIMTFMDNLILETEWHSTPATLVLQDYVRPYLSTFDEQTFLEWSQHHNFSIGPGMHPLENAHQAAADYMAKKITLALQYDDTIIYRPEI